MPSRYAIIGTGAVGGYYGAMLLKAGFNVHFLLNSDFEYVKQHGLKIDSINGNFTLPDVHVYKSSQNMPPCDIILITLKTTKNHLLPEILPPLLKPGSMVIMMQNGLDIEEEVASIANNCTILGGLCFICSNKIGPGHIRHLDYGQFTLGEYSPSPTGSGITSAIENAVKDFENAGISVTPVENLAIARWKKLVWNIPFNGLSVLLNTTTKELVEHPESRNLIRRMMEEVLSGADACGYHIKADFVDQMLEATDAMIPYLPSMKFDFDQKRPMEVDAIYRRPLHKTEDVGVLLPHVKMLYQQLKFLNDRNSIR